MMLVVILILMFILTFFYDDACGHSYPHFPYDDACGPSYPHFPYDDACGHSYPHVYPHFPYDDGDDACWDYPRASSHWFHAYCDDYALNRDDVYFRFAHDAAACEVDDGSHGLIQVQWVLKFR